MGVLRLSDIARVVAMRGTTAIDDTPIAADERGRWELYQGVNVVRRSRYQTYILYLYADCNAEAIVAAAAVLREPGLTEVIYPPSLERLITSNEDVQWALRKTQYRCTTRDYLFTCFEDSLDMYREAIKQLNPHYFVNPAVATDSDMEKPVQSLNAHFITTPRSAQQSPPLAVLIADAGQGKTYTTWRLAYNLLPSGVLPIYVDSRQWTNLSRDGLADLWKVITASFDFFKAPMPWVAGKEYDFLSVTMKAGLFTLIFDGFDEYTYWNAGRVDAAEALEELAGLAADSYARILVTARTSFWENDIMRHGPALALHSRYRLLPFDRAHAQTYFDNRLDDPSKVDRALQVYDSLRSASEDEGTNLVGRGFVLALLADLVDRAETLPPIPTTDSVTRRVMYALCERERVRQQISLTADEQLQVLGTFAEQVASGEAPTSELLEAAIALTVTLDEEAMIELLGDKTRKVRGKLEVHPLLEYRPATREWRIRQEQVYYNLLAEQLLACTASTDPILRDFVQKILPDARLRADIATVVVDQACASGDVGAAKSKVRQTVARLLGYSTYLPTAKSMPERDLATAIATLMMNRFVPPGKPRTERRDELLSYFPADTVDALQFSGTVAGISFVDVTLRHCRFDAVTFINCDFDKTTTFDRCRFVGGRLENCDGFGRAAFIEPWKDPDAAMLIESQQVLAQVRPYTKPDLDRDLALLIQKFAHKGGFGTRSIEEIHLRRGRFANSPWREEILRVFDRHLLERHDISRKGVGVHIRAEAKDAVMFYVNNGVLTGPLAQARDEIALQLEQ